MDDQGTDLTDGGSVITYDDVNNPPVVIAITVAFWLTLAAIGYGALKLKDSGWRFRISTLFAIMTAVAILSVFVRIMLIVPGQK